MNSTTNMPEPKVSIGRLIFVMLPGGRSVCLASGGGPQFVPATGVKMQVVDGISDPNWSTITLIP